MWNNGSGTSKFVQGLAIEIFILALYALSYELIFGITGMLSFGHSMFFAVGAYLTGIALKSFGLSLPVTFLLLVLASIVIALLFGVLLPRVKGITFALVTLGIASVFHTVISPASWANIRVQMLDYKVWSFLPLSVRPTSACASISQSRPG